jgi:prepilin-type processing-associated H-X9-DG protein
MDIGLGPESPVSLGVVDQCLLLTVGLQTLDHVLQGKTDGKAPQWLATAESTHGLDQLQSLGLFNVEKLWAQLLPALLRGDFDEQSLTWIRSMGLEQLRRIESVDGLAHQQRVNRWQLHLDGEANPAGLGLWSLFAGPGIARDAWREMPADSLFAYTVAIDLQRTVQFFERWITHIDGPESNPIAEFYEEFYRETGVDLDENVLGCLGHVWSIHNGAADGWLTGMVATTQLRDAARLSTAIEKVIDSFRRATQSDPEAPRVEKMQVDGQTIYSLQFPGNPVPVLPSWTIHEGRLRMALFPDSLTVPTQQPTKSLLEHSPELQTLLGTVQESDTLLMLSYVDMQRQFEVIYPYAQMMMAVMGNGLQGQLGGGPEAEAFREMAQGIALPPARVIHRHLLPSVALLTRNQAGLLYEVHSTLPAPDMTLAAPVAVGLLLPAVQQARGAARRVQSANNLKQLALAALNFESAYRRFPAAYSQSEEGRPLLSWRVHILPFIEEDRLYQQFKLDEPWDSPHNLALLEQMPAIYRSPQSQAEPGHTVYLGVRGQNAAFGNPQRSGRDSAATGGRLSAIVDGTSNTILAVEVADALAVPWTQPDGEIDGENFEAGQFYGQFPGGTNAAFCDGSVRFLPFLDQESWKALLGINDGIVVPQLNSDW